MPIVNTHEAKTNFSKLLRIVADGEEVTIARAGVPVAKLVAVTSPQAPTRVGFLSGLGFGVPDDFDTMMADDIEALFDGTDSV